MARPINNVKRIEPTQLERNQEALQELGESIAKHQDALQSLLTLIADLENSGVLEMLHALLNSKEKIASIVLDQVLKPSVLNTVKNGMTAMGTVSKIDPEELGLLMEAVVTGLHQGQESLKSKGKVGVFDLVKASRDPGVKRALGFMLGFLQGMGEKL
ncbi:MAG: DUF1641 domain-containing protein [Alicyclobacillus herbarius]|uniref:DUF1641 domain-containing protein n=1 Tax=Alicyclobacillus herbarius TaxID=122960 RepID=UPI0023527729|nr:DUF1641 domain-containing protein [Alicyclobacillus herbarius]MCL6633714.1 DUF1641 domain-containing protein [Alicyclobacillus herbarius]